MTMKSAIAVMFTVGAVIAQAPPPGSTQAAPAVGSISGVVRDSVTGSPMVNLLIRSGPSLSATTDAEGRYTLRNVPPGRHSIIAGSPATGISVGQVVTLGAGQKLESADFSLQLTGSISGKILDEKNEPAPGLEVALLGREYSAGSVRYFRRKVASTNDKGEYRLQDVLPGISYLLLVRQRNLSVNGVSDVPNDPKLRRRVLTSTYYPGSPTPEGGEILILRPGEKREGLDVRVLQSPSYCIEGVLRSEGRPAELSFWFHEQEPSYGLGPSGGQTGLPPGGRSGPDGRIRICDLHSGEYRLTAFSGDLNNPLFFGSTQVTISDRDVKDIAVFSQPRVPLAGQAIWAGAPPDRPINSPIGVLLVSLHRTAAGGLGEQARSSVPGEFSVRSGRGEDPLMDEYSVRVLGLAGGLYVKDITYGATSVIGGPLRLGSGSPGTGLRVIIGHDGGFLHAKVVDKGGKAVPGTNVILIPKAAGSEPEIAAMRITGQTDQNGDYASDTLAPGSYYVLATSAAVNDFSPESIGGLWTARSKAKEVEVGSNGTARITIEPIALN